MKLLARFGLAATGIACVFLASFEQHYDTAFQTNLRA